MTVKIKSILALIDELIKDVHLSDDDFKHIINRLKSPDESLKRKLVDIGVSEEEIRKIMKVTDKDLRSIEELFK